MNDIENNEDIGQHEENFSAENMEQPTDDLQLQNLSAEEEVVEDDDEADKVEAGVFVPPSKEEEKEEVQELHTKHCRADVPVIDHRLLAGKLSVYNWLDDIPGNRNIPEVVEVQFKNTRKGFFKNVDGLSLQEGDVVAVEAALGHDIGVVSLAGELVWDQIRLKRIDLDRNPLKKVYRKAKPNDIEKWQQAISQEHETMIRSRKIAADLRLNMKIGDVEYQGDKTKAIFYYIADDRVDFRTLIKVLAETFRIRIEMKQIGARQEAGRIGGIGPCGRKLCCSAFISNFISVSTSAARYQDISLNPQKLAGQCGKLKCCLNFEVDAYIDAQRDFPSSNVPLNTGDGMLYHQKTDIFGQTMSYAPDKEGKGVFVQIPVRRVKEIISLNRKGIIPPKAVDFQESVEVDIRYTDGVGEESLNRFDEKKQQRRRNSKGRGGNREGNYREGGNREGGNREGGNPILVRNERSEKNVSPENRNVADNNQSGNSNQRVRRPAQRRNPRPQNKQRPRQDQGSEPKSE